MPERTNDFQRLVALVQQAFAPKGARVTESAIVDVPGLEGGREIDVLLEGTFGPYILKIAIEAKDEGRKMDLVRFESIAGKYNGEGRVPVNKVVVVSHSGFTKNVFRRARQLGIELVKLSEASESFWMSLGSHKIHLNIAPHVDYAEFDPAVPADNRLHFFNHARIHCPHKKDLGTVRTFSERFLSQQVIPKKPDVLAQLQIEATQHDAGAVATFTLPLVSHIVRYNGEDFLAAL